MPLDSLNALTDALHALPLLEPGQMEEFEAGLRDRFPDVRALARELVRRGWLTPFQVNLLFQGRGNELLLGPFVLLERVATGRLGQVFKARRQGPQSPVALKVLRKELFHDPDMATRFRQEVAAAARLEHANLVLPQEAGEAGGTSYYTREFVEGTDLARFVGRRGPLPADEALDCVRQATWGLEYAHREGLVHPHLKPEHLLLTSDGGVTRVIDLAPACLMLSGPGAATAGGNPAYLAPEQRAGQPVDVRSSLFSLGRVGCFLLTGEVPVPGKWSDEELVARLTQCGLTPAQVAMFLRMTAPRPEDRFADFGAMLDALDPVPVEAPEEVPAAADTDAGSEPPSTLPSDLLPVKLAEPSSQTESGLLPEQPERKARAAGRGWLKVARQHPWWSAGAGALGLGLLVLGLVWLFSGSGKTGAGSEKWQATKEKKTGRGKEGDASAPVLLQPKVTLGDPRGRAWGAVRCLAWSKEAGLIASGGDDNIIRLWDPETLEEKFVLRGHTGPVNSLAFSPDGTLLLSGSEDTSMLLWDVRRRKKLRPVQPHTYPITSVVFSADGRRALSGSYPHALDLLNVETGALISTIGSSAGNVYIRSVALSRDGTHALSACSNGLANLWDIKTNSVICQCKGHTGEVLSVAFSPDEKLILTGGEDGTVRLWDRTGKEQHVYSGHKGPVAQAVFVSGGKQILSAGRDGLLILWDAEKGTEVRRYAGHRGAVAAVLSSPDGKRFLSAGQDRSLRLWDAASRKELLARAGHTSAVESIAFGPKGSRLVSGGADGTVRLWDLDTGKEERSYPAPFPGVSLVALLPDGRRIFSSSGTSKYVRDHRLLFNGAQKVTIWEADSKAIFRQYDWSPDPDLTQIAFSAGGNRLLCSSTTGNHVLLWDLELAKEIQGYQPNPFQPVSWTAFSPNGQLGLFASEDWTVRVWEVVTGKEVRRCVGPTAPVWCAAFTPDGKQIVAVAADHTAWRWEVSGDAEEQLPSPRIAADFPMSDAALSPDAKTVAVCSSDGRLILWDAITGKRLAERQLSGPILRVRFAPDGRLLATANANGTVSVFQLVPRSGNKGR